MRQVFFHSATHPINVALSEQSTGQSSLSSWKNGQKNWKSTPSSDGSNIHNHHNPVV